MLRVEDVHVAYDKVEVIKGVTFNVNQGEVVVIIGSNGAGKTTVINTIAGLLRPLSGSIYFNDECISDKLPAEKIVARGIALCPEGRQIFPQHTVYENLVLGGYLIRKDKALLTRRIEQMYEMFPILRTRYKQMAGTLSGGEQQMLAIARAMMIDPKLLLLDEPSAGLAPIYVQAVFDMIADLARNYTTILLVEQMANIALDIADRAYVLETGSISMEGSAADIKKDPRIIESYLGKKG